MKWYEKQGYKDEPVGVYGYRCLKTNKWYIGQTRSSGSFRVRDRSETRELDNKVSKLPRFQRAWTKYKRKGFTSQLILEWRDRSSFSSKKEMVDWCNQQERKWIRVKNSFHGGYNCTTGGESYLISDESRIKMSAAKKGKTRQPHSAKTIEKMKQVWTPEKKAEASALALSGWDEERKREMSERFSGENSYTKRPEVREKIRQSKLGEKNPMSGKYGGQNPNAKFTNDEADEIRRLRDLDPHRWSFQKIADRFGCERHTVAKIVKGVSYK